MCQSGLIKQKTTQLGLDGIGLLIRYTKLIANKRFVTGVNLCSRLRVAAVCAYLNGDHRRMDALGVHSGSKVTGAKSC